MSAKSYTVPKLEVMQGLRSRDNIEKETRLYCNLILNRFYMCEAFQNFSETDNLNGLEEECKVKCPDNVLL